MIRTPSILALLLALATAPGQAQGTAHALPVTPPAPPAPIGPTATPTPTGPTAQGPASDRARHCVRGCLSPVEAVTYASYLAPKAALAGDFEMEVKGVGEDRGSLFLNSEADYRDRNCLTIAMPIVIARRLTGKSDMADIKAAFAGKRISVRGVARRVRIDFLDHGKPTGKYYYQIHVPVGRPEQLLFEGAGRSSG